MSKTTAALVLLCLLAAAVFAQRDAGIDYDNVSDILNGHHYLLEEDDLIVTARLGNLRPLQNLLYTSNSEISGKNTRNPDLKDGRIASKAPGAVAVANMFRNAAPVVVYGVAGVDSPLLKVLSSSPNNGASETVTLAGPKGSNVRQLVVGDFNGDGLDDILAVHGDGYLTVCTAKNPALYDLRLRCELSSVRADYTFQRLTAGDFEGIGRVQLAWAYHRPGSSNSILWIAEVDPRTLEIKHVTNYEGLATGALNTLDITAGKFAAPGGTPNQQLAFAYAGRSGTAKVDIINFASKPFAVSAVKTWDTGYTPGANNFSKIILKAAPLAGFNRYDQIALVVSEDKYTGFLAVLKVQPETLSVSKGGWVFLRDVGVHAWKLTDLAIGNFDRKNSAGKHDAIMQIAIAAWDKGPKDLPKYWNVYLFNVDPQRDYRLSLQQQFVDQNATPEPQQAGSQDASLTIAAADVQQRSINLGPPTKIVINSQGGPSIVTGVPPMHVDFIAPSGSNSPKLLNLSGIPDGFSTSYKVEASAKKQVTTQNTTSYTFGLAQSLEGKLTFGNPKKNSLSVGLQLAAAQTFEDGVEKQNSNTGLRQYSASVQTGESDQVWYDESRLNVYSYPVLGQSSCPPQIPENCDAKLKVPLTIEFSAIDRVTSASAAGSQIEWYQPAWEYGNVLSYPASYSQLQQLYPDLEELADGTTFFTDASKQEATTSWSNSTSQGETVSSARRFSEEGGVSVSGGVSIPIIGGLEGGGEFNISGSQAFANLNTTLTDLDTSSGVVIEKPGNFTEPRRYAYGITPYIFGRTQHPEAVDTADLTGEVKTAGPLQAAFVANPLFKGSGDWWRQAYSKAPDVALNHPARWVFAEDSKGTEPNCAGGICVTLAPSHANNPWLSDFHAMRGFFISDAVSPGQGPQLSRANAGDKLVLEARVYNYSFVPMPEGSTVHVRFYVQPMSPQHALLGPSKLIGEKILAPIPPFSDDEEAPLNSVLARMVFDTSNYSDQYITFWVVTWMEDASGAMVREPESHGLLAIPGELSSLADVKTEQYSNNTGFYKWLFYVAPQKKKALFANAVQTTSSSELSGVSTVAALQEAQLSAIEVSSGQKAARDEEVTITTGVRAGDQPIPGAIVTFYDGDPRDGGRIFDMENVSYVRPNETLEVEVPFRSGTCGSHDLYAVTFAGTVYEKVSDPFVLQVDCPAK